MHEQPEITGIFISDKVNIAIQMYFQVTPPDERALAEILGDELELTQDIEGTTNIVSDIHDKTKDDAYSQIGAERPLSGKSNKVTPLPVVDTEESMKADKS